MTAPRVGTVLVLLVALLVSGCGTARSARPAAPVAVIRGWADALRRGDVSAAAGYFARPSLFANGSGPFEVRDEHDAVLVNESLSCGARLTATRRSGRYILATFELTRRTGPGAGCGSGTGESAAVDFLIRGGRIVDWIRAPTAAETPTITAPSSNPPSAGQSI